MVIPTHNETTASGFPEAGTPGQEAAQKISDAAAHYLGGERRTANRVILADDATQAIWDLIQAHKDDGDRTAPVDLENIQDCIVLLVDRVLAEVYTAGGPSDRTMTWLERLAIMLQPDSEYTAGIARKTLTELLDSEVPA